MIMNKKVAEDSLYASPIQAIIEYREEMASIEATTREFLADMRHSVAIFKRTIGKGSNPRDIEDVKRLEDLLSGFLSRMHSLR
jgi:hypothetical protein